MCYAQSEKVCNYRAQLHPDYVAGASDWLYYPVTCEREEKKDFLKLGSFCIWQPNSKKFSSSSWLSSQGLRGKFGAAKMAPRIFFAPSAKNQSRTFFCRHVCVSSDFCVAWHSREKKEVVKRTMWQPNCKCLWWLRVLMIFAFFFLCRRPAAPPPDPPWSWGKSWWQRSW